jgi:hypothetical protein
MAGTSSTPPTAPATARSTKSPFPDPRRPHRASPAGAGSSNRLTAGCPRGTSSRIEGTLQPEDRHLLARAPPEPDTETTHHERAVALLPLPVGRHWPPFYDHGIGETIDQVAPTQLVKIKVPSSNPPLTAGPRVKRTDARRLGRELRCWLSSTTRTMWKRHCHATGAPSYAEQRRMGAQD